MADIENPDDLTLELETLSRDVAMETANRVFSHATEVLYQAGDERGYEVHPVAQSAQPPQWDDHEQAAVMAWPHRASVYFNHGTTAHEIEGDPVLAFEWEEMRGEEFADTGQTFEEVFDDFPTVFLPRVEVEGIDRIGFVDKGLRKGARWARQQGGR